MIDIKFIQQNPEIIKKALLKRGIDFNIDNITELNNQRKKILLEIEQLRQKRNKLSEEISILKRKKEVNEDEISRLVSMVNSDKEKIIFFQKGLI